MTIEAQFMEKIRLLENVLVRSRYLKDRDGRAEVDWMRFAGDLGLGFFKKVRDSKKACTILSAPPQQFRTKDKKLYWHEKFIRVTNSTELIEAVLQIRANYAHGHKSVENSPDMRRDEALLQEAAWIIGLAFEEFRSRMDEQTP